MRVEDTIVISGHVDLQAVANWRSEKEVIVDVHSDGNLDALAEACALSFIYGCKSNNKKIIVKCRFDPLEGGQRDFFYSLFGLALCYVADEFFVNGNTHSISSVRQKLWGKIYAGRGFVGDAKRHVIVFREPDYLVPECLAIYLSGRSAFPLTSGFKAFIRETVLGLGFHKGFGISSQEDMLGQFLYEVSRNSYEHGRMPIKSGAPLAIRGIRVEKLMFSSSEDFERRLPGQAQIRRYFKQNWLDGARKNPFLSITVSDIGLGIQNTLKPLSDNLDESAWDRIERAIFTAATSKPEGDEIERGRGLGKVVAAAEQLDALLLVQSAGLFGYIDFSIPAKYSRREGPLEKLEIVAPGVTSGTAWQLIWPLRQIGRHQIDLPLFSAEIEGE